MAGESFRAGQDPQRVVVPIITPVKIKQEERLRQTIKRVPDMSNFA
jgi:hypothetical protein